MTGTHVSREVDHEVRQGPRHSVSIHEEEVCALIHRPVELHELQPSRFTGRVASWAEHAAHRYGDAINPVMTYVGTGRIASRGSTTRGWIGGRGNVRRLPPRLRLHRRRRGQLAVGVRRFDLGCRAVLRALQRRAAFVDHTYRTCEILAALRDPSTGDFEQPNTFHSSPSRRSPTSSSTHGTPTNGPPT